MRDVETDRLLLRLRYLFNLDDYTGAEELAVLMSDWLEDRGRSEEAELLRSGEWNLAIGSGQGWPPPCRILPIGVCLPDYSIYYSPTWMNRRG